MSLYNCTTPTPHLLMYLVMFYVPQIAQFNRNTTQKFLHSNLASFLIFSVFLSYPQLSLHICLVIIDYFYNTMWRFCIIEKDYFQAIFQNNFTINMDAIIFSASENLFGKIGKVVQRQIKDLHSICKGCHYYF